MKSNIEVLVNIGLGERAKDDALLVRDTCTVLLTLSKTEEKVRIKYVGIFDECASKLTLRKKPSHAERIFGRIKGAGNCG